MSTQKSKQKKAVTRPEKPERRVRVRIADLVRNAASSKKLVADMPYAQKLTVGRIVRSIQRRLEEDEQAQLARGFQTRHVGGHATRRLARGLRRSLGGLRGSGRGWARNWDWGLRGEAHALHHGLHRPGAGHGLRLRLIGGRGRRCTRRPSCS